MKPEQAFQRQVAGFLKHALKPPAIFSAIGHGGGGRVRGAQLKAMGLRAGLPDIIVLAPSGDMRKPVLIGFELKSATGRQSPEQKDVERDWRACGGYYFVARDLYEIEGFLVGVGVPLHATVTGIRSAA